MSGHWRAAGGVHGLPEPQQQVAYPMNTAAASDV